MLEEHGYISIRRGFVVAGELGEEFRLPGSLEPQCSAVDLFLNKIVLVLEAMGLVTIQRGVIGLSEAGITEYAKIDLGADDRNASGDTSGGDGGGHEVTISDRISAFIGRCATANESTNDVIRRLIVMSESPGAAKLLNK